MEVNKDKDNKFNAHFESYIKYVRGIKSNRFYKLLKKFTYLNHTRGPHMDFYNNPLGFNGSTLNKKVNKLRSKLIKAMICFVYTSKNKIYLHNHIIDIINEQLEKCTSNDDYWKRYGFNDKQIVRINVIYNMFKLFLQDYALTKHHGGDIIGMGGTDTGDKMYEYNIKLITSLEITPKALQDFAFRELERKCKELCELDGVSLSPDIALASTVKKIMDAEKIKGTPIENEHTLFVECKKILISHHQKMKDMFDKRVKLPNVNKMTVKPIPTMLSKWASKGRANKNNIYVNTKRLDVYKMEILPRLMAHEGIPGHLLGLTNHYRQVERLKIPKKVKPIIMRGIKMLKEGWALYAERLVLDITNPNIKRSLIMNEIYYCVRTIIDIGLNYSKATVIDMDSAEHLLKSYTALSDESITAEIYKCIANPGNASSYMMGLIFYQEMEAICRRELREKFNMRNYLSKLVTSPLNAKELYNYMTTFNE